MRQGDSDVRGVVFANEKFHVGEELPQPRSDQVR